MSSEGGGGGGGGGGVTLSCATFTVQIVCYTILYTWDLIQSIRGIMQYIWDRFREKGPNACF